MLGSTHGLAGWLDGAFGPPALAEFVPIYSQVAGGVFVVGGRDIEDGVHHGRIGMRARVLVTTGGIALVIAMSVVGCPTATTPEAELADGGARAGGEDAAAARADARPVEDPDPIPPEGLPPG